MDSSPSTGDTPPRSGPSAPRTKNRYLNDLDDTPIPGRNKQASRNPSTSESTGTGTGSGRPRSQSLPPPTETGETSAEEAIYGTPIGPSSNVAMPADPAIQAAVDTAVNAGMDRVLARMQEMLNGPAPPQGPPGPTGLTGPPGPPGLAGEASGSPRWHAGDIGFFDPHYDGKSASSGSALEYAGKDTIFRDVHVFVDRAKDIASTKGDELVRNNLSTCLRGQALIWYTSELTDGERRLLKYGNHLDEWIEALTRQFRESPAKAMEVVTSERYTTQDARRQREPREYAQTMVRAARSAELPIYNQLQIIWNGLDAEFQRDVPMPRTNTTLNAFLKDLDDRKEIWWKLMEARSGLSKQEGTGGRRDKSVVDKDKGQDRSYDRGNQGYGSRGMLGASSSNFRPRFNQQGGGYNQFFRLGLQPAFQSQSFMPGFANFAPQQQTQSFPWQNRAYQTQNDQQPYQQRGQSSNDQPPPRALPAPPQPKQITAGPAAQNAPSNGSNSYQKQRQPFRRYDGNQRRRPSQAQPAYWGAQDQENYMDHDDRGAYYGDGGYYDDGEYYDDSSNEAYAAHPNEDKDEVESDHGATDVKETADVNFIGASRQLPIVCRFCQTEFSSNNKLHRHVRVCRKSTTEAVDAHHGHHLGGSLLTPPTTIIESTAPPTTQPGYGFRS